MPSSARTGSTRGSKSGGTSPKGGGSRSQAPSLGSAPTRTQSLVARIFSNPLKKSGVNRSSGSSPREQSPSASPLARNRTAAPTPASASSPPHNQAPSPTRGTASISTEGHHNPYPSRSPVRSPSYRPGRSAPPALYPPGASGGVGGGGARTSAESSGNMHASSGEVSFDSRGLRKDAVPNPSGSSTIVEDTISVPLKPSRTPRPDDVPAPLNLFPHDAVSSVSSAGAVAGTTNVSKQLLNMRPVRRMDATEKRQVKEGAAARAPTPEQVFHDPTNTVTTNASAANTFNEEVDERAIIPVGDQITLQQLSGALDDPTSTPAPTPTSPTFCPVDSTGFRVPHTAAQATEATNPTGALTGAPSASGKLKPDAHTAGLAEDESSQELSWGLQKLHSRARGGAPSPPAAGVSPTGPSAIPRPPSPGATASASQKLCGAAAAAAAPSGAAEQFAAGEDPDAHNPDSERPGEFDATGEFYTTAADADADAHMHDNSDDVDDDDDDDEDSGEHASALLHSPAAAAACRASRRAGGAAGHNSASIERAAEYDVEYTSVQEIVPAEGGFLRGEEFMWGEGEGPLEAVPHARSLLSGQQDARFHQIPSARFSIHEMEEDSAEMRVTGSPPTEPHTTVAQCAALGQMVPNSISSEVSERHAQAFRAARTVDHPDGDDALAHAHALPPAAGAGPSVDVYPDSTVVSASAADSASGAPVATADNGTPVASPAVTQDAAAPVATDNPYVVIQKSGAPAQPSSARLFYQPPTSLNAAAPGSINSNAGAQAGMAAGAAMLSAQAGAASTSGHHAAASASAAPPENVAVSAAAPSNSNPPTATDSEYKRSGSITLDPRGAHQQASRSNEPTALPVAATGVTTSPAPTPAAAANAAAAIAGAPLSSSPPAPGTPQNKQRPRVLSHSNSLYSQAFGPPPRSRVPPPQGSSQRAPAPHAAVQSAGFTYSKKPYSAYGVAGGGGAPHSTRSARGAAPHPSHSVAAGGLRPGASGQNGHLHTGSLGACGHVVPPPLSSSSVRSVYGASSAPASTPYAHPPNSGRPAARYSSSSGVSAYGGSSPYTPAYSSASAARVSGDHNRPAFGAAARMRGLANDLERPGSHDGSPVRRDVVTMRERMNASRVPYATGPTPAQLEARRRLHAHSGALPDPRSPQGAASPAAPPPAPAHAAAKTPAKAPLADPPAATPPTPSGQRSRSIKSPSTQRPGASVSAAQQPSEPAPVAPTTAETATKVAAAATAAMSPQAETSPQASGALAAGLPSEAAAAVEAAFAVPVAAEQPQQPPAQQLAAHASGERARDVEHREPPPAATDVWARLPGKKDPPAKRVTGIAGASSAVSPTPRRGGGSSSSSRARAAGAGVSGTSLHSDAADAAAGGAAAAVAAAVPAAEGASGASEEWTVDERLPRQGFRLAMQQARMRSPFAAEPREGSHLSLVLVEVHGGWLMGAGDRTGPLLVAQRSSLPATSSAQPLAGR